MGKRNAPLPSGQLVHLVLRGHRPQTLVQTDDDWRALGVCASRMLFWCGGTIYGCRCDRTRIHFALQIAHASIGAMAQHVSAAYAAHLWNRRRWGDVVFNHYLVIPLPDEIFLDDFGDLAASALIELHRRDGLWPRLHGRRRLSRTPCLPWVNTQRVLQALSARSSQEAYRRRKNQAIPLAVIDLLTRRTAARGLRGLSLKSTPADSPAANRRSPFHRHHRPRGGRSLPCVAEELRSASRKRSASKGQGHRHRPVYAQRRQSGRRRPLLQSQPIDPDRRQAERYRQTQSGIFADAEAALEAYLDAASQ